MLAGLSPNLHGVGPVGDAVKAPLCNGSGQDGGGGGSIARLFVGLVGHVLDKLGPDVLELVFKLDGLGNGDAVFGDLGGQK